MFRSRFMIDLEVWPARLGFGCQSRTGVSYKARLPLDGVGPSSIEVNED